MRRTWMLVAAALVLAQAAALGQTAPKKKRLTREEAVNTILTEAQPLKHPRGDRLPLFIWRLIGASGKTEAETEKLLSDLNDRGLAVITTWRDAPQQREKFIKEATDMARVQKKLGLPIVTFANPLLHMFFNGDASTAHVDEAGNPFFDTSVLPKVKLGCPFSVKHRYDEIRGRVEAFAQAYQKEGLPLDLVFADWEVDGPIEWNGGWDAAKKCRRCREAIPNVDDFVAVQKAFRTVRAEMLRECYAAPILKAYPKALVGNYGVNPHNGWRYWYDYFEKEPTPGMAFQMDQRCPVRKWFDEFPISGFNYANPVIYTWHRTYAWYDYKNPDYRWFYGLLLEATSVCQNTPRGTPIIAFIHWTTTAPPEGAEPVPQFSEAKYQELLWHMLLRGTDGLAMWCMDDELAVETRLAHQVYAASLEYREFLDKGEPVCFDVPKAEGPVVSGLKLGDRVLAIRSDFTDAKEPVAVTIDGKPLAVPRNEGRPQVLSLR